MGRGPAIGRVTRPAFRHFVHTWMCRVDPSTTARTRWMFGFHRRLPRLWENEIVFPNRGSLPQMSQTAAMT